MPSNYFSRLRGSFRQGIQQSYDVLEGSFVDTLEVLPVHGKLLLGTSGSYCRTFAAFSDLNILFQRGSSVAAQSSNSQRKNITVVGTVSRTLSTPSVSGPPFQVCGYHVDNLLTGPGRFPISIGSRKVPTVLPRSNALIGRYYQNYITSRHGKLMASIKNPNISSASRRFHSGNDAAMGIKNKEQSDSILPRYLIWHVGKTSGNCDPFIGSERESFHTSSPACLSASTASDLSFDDQRSSSAGSDDRTNQEGRSLKLVSGSCYLPHPEKEEKGGEDAHFICSDKRAIGVADGVGGWVDLGVDAGIYARELMYNSLIAVQDEPTSSSDPARVLEKAHANTKAKGSSTACIITLTDQGLSAINLGDSGFMVVRDGCTLFRSPAQQHNFNFTYQLQNGGNGDSPSSGQVFSVRVAPGDVIVAGTDGLFDNLYNNDITAVVVHAVRAGLGPHVMAQKIAALARQRAQEKDRQTPFSAAAQEAGIRYYGGKLDDITVVVSYITASKDVMHLDAEKEMMSQCVALLGKFIAIREPNIRYLGLENMTRMLMVTDIQEIIKRHQTQIITSLKDPDISIQRRALDLLYGMCDVSNAKDVVEELLQYLGTADFTMRQELALKAAILAEKFAPDLSWYVVSKVSST